MKDSQDEFASEMCQGWLIETTSHVELVIGLGEMALYTDHLSVGPGSSTNLSGRN
jgi:hypothetical protein